MEEKTLKDIDKGLLNEVSNLDDIEKGAFNIRKNGKGIERKVTPNVNIVNKEDNSGIDIYVKEDTKFEFIHIPVIITESGLKDVVYNDFHIGKNANVIIVAGCGLHNDHHKDSEHDGIHRFYLEEGAKVNPIIKDKWSFVWVAVAPFNVFKGIIVGIVTGILYKRISTFIKKL